MNDFQKNLPEDLKKELENLVKDYAQNLPKEIQKLEDLWEQRDLPSLHRRFHTLAGSGASFGFGKVSNLARSLEMLLSSSLEKRVPLTEEQKQQKH